MTSSKSFCLSGLEFSCLINLNFFRALWSWKPKKVKKKSPTLLSPGTWNSVHLQPDPQPEPPSWKYAGLRIKHSLSWSSQTSILLPHTWFFLAVCTPFYKRKTLQPISWETCRLYGPRSFCLQVSSLSDLPTLHKVFCIILLQKVFIKEDFFLYFSLKNKKNIKKMKMKRR